MGSIYIRAHWQLELLDFEYEYAELFCIAVYGSWYDLFSSQFSFLQLIIELFPTAVSARVLRGYNNVYFRRAIAIYILGRVLVSDG